MNRECHPAWKDYHFGRVQAGDTVENVIAQTEPLRVERNGKWVILKYQERGFTGLTCAAYDERMVCAYAWSCCWMRQFFDVMSKEQREEFFKLRFDQPARVGGAVLVD